MSLFTNRPRYGEEKVMKTIISIVKVSSEEWIRVEFYDLDENIVAVEYTLCSKTKGGPFGMIGAPVFLGASI
jgi:hypothetical protein